MKKTFFTFLLVLSSLLSWGQIITTNPTFITDDYNGVIEIIYDASLGTAGLKDYVGTDGIYAHTGVITSSSTSNADWKHAPTWGDNATKYKLTSLGNNKWKLLIAPSMSIYYSLNTGEIVKKIAFVFRNGLKTKEGKDVGGTDILVNVYQAGLNVAITNPTSNQSISVGSVVDFSVASTVASDLNLSINGTSVKAASSATTLTHSHTFGTTGDFEVIASATLGAQTVFDTVKLCVPEPVTNQARPSGIKNGINYNSSTSVTLVLHAPNKSNVFLIGEFNDWSQLNAYQLKKDGEYWWITLNDLTPERVYAYQYLVDGTIKISDPYSEMVLDPWNDKWINEKSVIYTNLKAYPEGKTEGLVATFKTGKVAYNWEIPNFSMPSRENMVIYELLIRDFTTQKSLNATIDKLDYLKTLGVTAIELMPIQEFDGNNSWGYNPNHYFAADKAYGNQETYKKFIDECHKRGMAVIVDVVFNHATGNFPYAKLWWNSTTNKTAANNPYFNVDATHPYSVFHDFNHEYQPTRDYFKQVLQYWITEYKIDGYRLDLTKGFTQRNSTEATASNYDDSRINILTDYYNAAKAVKSDVMFILEHFCDYSEELELVNRGMYVWRNSNNSYSQAAMGFQSNSDFGGMNSTPRRWVGFAESHDEERNFYKAKAFGVGTVKTDSIVRINRVPLNIAFTTLVPGPKMVWQFGELGYDLSIDSYGGRTNEKPSAWSFLNLDHRRAAYDAASKIITLRRLYPKAFTEGDFSLQIGASDWSNGRRIALTHNDLKMIVLGNFDPANKVSAYPNFPSTGSWYNLLTGQIHYVANTTTPIELNAGQLLILTDRQVNFPNAVEKVSFDSNTSVYPALTDGLVYVLAESPVHAIRVYSMQGALIKSEFNQSQTDLTGLNTGMYFVEVVTNRGKEIHKVIKH